MSGLAVIITEDLKIMIFINSLTLSSSASPRFNDHCASDFPAVAQVIQPLPNLGGRVVQIRNISGFESLPQPKVPGRWSSNACDWRSPCLLVSS